MMTRLLHEPTQQALLGFIERRLLNVDRFDGAQKPADRGTEVAIKEAAIVVARDLQLHVLSVLLGRDRKPARTPTNKAVPFKN